MKSKKTTRNDRKKKKDRPTSNPEKTYKTKKYASKKTQKSENIQLMGILHLLGTIIGGRGRLAVIIFYLIKQEQFSATDKKVFYDIINFTISFLLYCAISIALITIIIGIPLIIVVGVTYLVILIVSFTDYIKGKRYTMPRYILPILT